MLTTRSIRHFALFTGCLVLGLLLGNRIVLAASLLPLSTAVLGLLISSPGNPAVRSKNIAARTCVGDVMEVSYEITAGGGPGSLSFYQELPSYFALVEGNNLRVFWKGWSEKTCVFSYKVRCTKRGIYTLPPLQWVSYHALRLIQSREGALGGPSEITVHPRLLNVRRIRGLPGIASSPFPVIDVARIGVATTDFRQIRDYIYGDPVKNINWKATARNTSPALWPLTNEYEVEGKKAVWLFLDTSRILEVGTEIENVFEYCLEAANGVACYFLDRGYRVGMYIFNGGGKLFYPDAGRKQFLKISRELIGLESGKEYDRFPAAVEKCRRYILGYNPLCVIITALDNRFSEYTALGIKKIRLLSGRRRRKLPVMVLNIAGYNLIPGREEYDKNSALLLQLRARPRIVQLQRLGAAVLSWNPRRESLGSLLLKQVKKP